MAADIGLFAAALALAFNYVTVTGLIFVNKILFAYVKFPSTTLTALHLTFTASGIEAVMRLGWVSRPEQRLEWKYVGLLAVLQGTAIVAGNASLTFNSTAFYQLAKQLQLPTVLLLELLLYKKLVSLPRFLCLAGAVAGVIYATANDLQFNFFGASCAFFGVTCTAAEVVLWSRLQQHQGWGSLQLLGSVSPYGALLTTAAAAALEGRDVAGKVAAGAWEPRALVTLAVSCSTALLVNWSTVMVSGKASAITYALLGLFKTATVIAGGALFFEGRPQNGVVAGAAAAILCIFAYSLQNIKEQKRRAEEQRQQAPSPVVTKRESADDLPQLSRRQDSPDRSPEHGLRRAGDLRSRSPRASPRGVRRDEGDACWELHAESCDTASLTPIKSPLDGEDQKKKTSPLFLP